MSQTGYALEPNADGSVIVKLDEPVRDAQRVEQTRLTIPRITGRHMRAATWTLHAPATLGELATFAAAVIEPPGIFDELPAAVARNLSVEVVLMLGKTSQQTGEERSPT